jgi:Zn-dependent protease
MMRRYYGTTARKFAPFYGILTGMTMAMIVFEFVVLLFSAVLHEIAHGFTAEWLGDDTAKRAGRLTLNPLVHLDLFGSIILPIVLYIGSGGSFFFAAAKPVPYDPRNLKDPRWGGAEIAIAGPLTNLFLALVFGVAVRVAVFFSAPAIFVSLLAIIVYLNVALGIFNLVPIPPLDGSRILFAALPQNRTTFRVAIFLERYGIFFVLLFAFFGFMLILPIIGALFGWFTGQPLPF